MRFPEPPQNLRTVLSCVCGDEDPPCGGTASAWAITYPVLPEPAAAMMARLLGDGVTDEPRHRDRLRGLEDCQRAVRLVV
jgi:hypothetical protein